MHLPLLQQFLPVTVIFELALTFQLDPDCVDVPAVQHTNNLCQKSFHLKVIVHTHTHTHTHTGLIALPGP